MHATARTFTHLSNYGVSQSYQTSWKRGEMKHVHWLYLHIICISIITADLKCIVGNRQQQRHAGVPHFRTVCV